MLEAVIPFTAERFGRAIIMPNLSPEPVTTTERLRAYRQRIQKAIGSSPFIPLMTYYLTDNSSPTEITEGFKSGEAAAVKLYPAGATTNSDLGITKIENAYPVFEAMEEAGMPVLMHGERVRDDAGNDIAPPDREKAFLDAVLPGILRRFPRLKIVLEHATTKDAVDFVSNDTSGRLAATITAHHLILSSEEIRRAEKPAYVHCLPVVKSQKDREALRKAATSGDSHFFLGTDSAPHPMSAKEKPEGYPAGIFTAPAGIELYAHVFGEEGKLENLEAFASLNGPAFYTLPPNEEKITLEENPWTINSPVALKDGGSVYPLGYNENPSKRLTIAWKLA